LKILLLNGSGRKEYGNSECILRKLREFLEIKGETDIEECRITKNPDDYIDICNKMQVASVIVLSNPIYYSSLPAFILLFLQKIRQNWQENGVAHKVYFICNCGYYEPDEGENCIYQLKQWTKQMNFEWGQGLSVGASEMMGKLRNIPVNVGPNQIMGEKLNILSDSIINFATGENLYSIPAGISKKEFFVQVNKRWDYMIKTGIYHKKMFDENGNEI